MRTTGHLALVTGGSRGIGLAIARALLAAGNQVIITGRDEARLAQARTLLGTAWAHRVDHAQADETDAFVRRVLDEIGCPSLLVNNAGVQQQYGLCATHDVAARFTRELDVNLLGPIRLTQSLLPAMLRSGTESAVVNVTSALALVPKQAAPSYCASKAALRSYTQNLRWHLEGTVVRVFELLPPRVDTDMTAGSGGDKLNTDLVARALLDAIARNEHEVMPGVTARLWELLRRSPEEAATAVRHM